MNTLRVKSPSPKYTYYCGLLWNGGQDAGGYCGMQEHPSGRNFIFSLWDPISTSDPITADYAHPATELAIFGGEGTGLRSLNYGIGWDTDQWYTLLSRVWTDHLNFSYFGFWIYDQNEVSWQHMVTMKYPVPNLRFNTATSSFIEDWRGNGYLARTINHKNGWKRKISDMNWMAFEQSYFDRVYPDAGTVNYIEKYDGGVIDEDYYFMTSGGNTDPITNEDDVMLYLPNPKSAPLFPNAEINTLELVVENNNTLLLTWEVNHSKSPQFSYHVNIYDSIELSGEPLISVDTILPHQRNRILDISLLPPDQYVLQFYITDLFDQVSNTRIVSFDTRDDLGNEDSALFNNARVVPNPVSKSIHLYLNRKLEDLCIELVDLNGKLILNKKMKQVDYVEIPVASSAGLYFLNLKSKRQKKTIKIIKH